MCGVRNLCSIVFFVSCEKMTKDEEIRMINEKLDFYVDFWDYCEERQREERIIAEMKIKGLEVSAFGKSMW